MCDWRAKHLKEQSRIASAVQYDGSGNMTIRGQIRNAEPDSYIVFWAANPPDYRTSYSGSGLPYPNSQIAYESSPNRGTVQLRADGSFEFRLRPPASYYTGLGTVFMRPHVYVQVNSKKTIGTPVLVRTGEGTPYRLLSYPHGSSSRCSPNFYAGGDTLPVRTQEQILRDSAYPSTNTMAPNFWGLTPPH